MKFEDLPPEVQEQVNQLKHFSQTIQADVLGALESAKNLDEFKLKVFDSMGELIGEAQRVRTILGTGKGVIVHG
jgi:hypothetical protein